MSYNTDFIKVLDQLQGHYQVKGVFMKARAYEKARDSLILHQNSYYRLKTIEWYTKCR